MAPSPSHTSPPESPRLPTHLIEQMLPEEAARYQDLLRLEIAMQSPLDLACLLYPETERWPQLELLNEHLVALAEYRLTADGPVRPEAVQWWYIHKDDSSRRRQPALSPHHIPSQREVRAYGATARGAAADGGEGKPIVFNLAVSMMPRAGKSRLITEVFPLWLLLKDPDMQIGLGTYSDSFAGDWGEAMKTMTMAHHSAYTEAGRTPFLPFPEGGSRAARDIFKVQGHTGKIRYTGTGGAVTGKTLHALIGDDFVKNEDDIISDANRFSLHRFIDSTWETRKTRNLKPGCFLPIPIEVRMATRWHRMDPIGYSCYDEETNEPNPLWCIVNIPALATDPDTDPLRRSAGEGHPNAAGRTEEDLERLQVSDPRTFAALYQGNPVIEGGGLVSTDFKFYTHGGVVAGEPGRGYLMWRMLGANQEDGDPPELHTMPLSECIIFAAADMAATKKTSADYTVLGIFAYSREHDQLFLLHLYRKRITTDQYNEELVPLLEDYRCSTTVVENVTYGQTFGQGLERKRMQVDYADAASDKVARVIDSQVSGRIRRGALRVPRSAPYLPQLVSECGHFPNDDHDDQVDVLAFANKFVSELPSWRAPKENKVLTVEDRLDAQVEKQAATRTRRPRDVWSGMTRR